MKAVTRWLAVVVAVVGLASATVLVVREVVLAVADDVAWGRPDWYATLVDDRSWYLAGVAGLAAIAAAVVLVVAVVWLAVPGGDRGGRFELGAGDARATVSLGTLERLLARVAGAELGPAGRVRRARVARDQSGLTAHLRADLQATDLPALHARLLGRARDALGVATGLEVVSLTLEVDQLVPPQKGTS